MSVSPDLDIRGQLTALRQGTRSLSEFSRWFAETIDVADSIADGETWDLFVAVENLLAEYTAGHRTPEEVQDALSSLAVSGAASEPVPSR